jgi:N-acetylneuraminic acid mutarotase
LRLCVKSLLFPGRLNSFLALALALATCGAGPDAIHTMGPASVEAPPGPIRPLISTASGSMSTARSFHTATLLVDGRVLVAGGDPPEANQTAEIFDPRAGAWKRTATVMNYTHASAHLASRLDDGRVLVAGGFSHSTAAEIYDPAADTWTKTGGTGFGHTYGTAMRLNDGLVLAAGGYDAENRAETYDPAKKKWSAVAVSMAEARFFHTATKLGDGRVLVAGGGVDNNLVWSTSKTAEIYDPGSRKFSPAKPMKHARRSHSATLLSDGRVLIIGGTDGGMGNDAGTQLGTTEIYDPSSDTWSDGPSIGTERSSHTVATLADFAVMIAGGIDNTGSGVPSIEVFFGGQWTTVDPMTTDRVLHTATILDDGGVLLAGGIHQATAEIYRPDPNGSRCSSGARCASGACASGFCCDTACDSGCRSCAVPGFEGTCTTPCADDTHVMACADGSADCAEGATCAPLGCAPFRCDAVAGACGTTCKSVADCAPGYACDLAHRCVPLPDVAGGAGCSLAGSPGDGAALALLLAVLSVCGYTRSRRCRRFAERPTSPWSSWPACSWSRGSSPTTPAATRSPARRGSGRAWPSSAAS